MEQEHHIKIQIAAMFLSAHKKWDEGVSWTFLCIFILLQFSILQGKNLELDHIMYIDIGCAIFLQARVAVSCEGGKKVIFW